MCSVFRCQMFTKFVVFVFRVEQAFCLFSVSAR